MSTAKLQTMTSLSETDLHKIRNKPGLFARPNAVWDLGFFELIVNKQ